jgi:phage major head subunit gpT-like protein
METRATWGAGWIAGLGAKVMQAENQADNAYSMAINSALGLENNTYTRLFKDRKTSQARETMVTKTGVGYFTETSEGSDYAADTRSAGYVVQWNPIKKTSSIEITEEDAEDRDRDVADKMDEVTDLKVAYMMTADRDAFSLFNYAYTAQASLPNQLTFYADGKPVCSVAHPILASTTSNSTQSNASSTGITLTETNLETGRQALRRQNDDKDLPMNIGSGRIVLLVPDALEKTAAIIAKSNLRSGTANNDMNIYDGFVTVISTKWINSQQTSGSDTAWFLIDSLHSPAIFLSRRGFKSSIWVDNKNKNVVYDASFRYQVGNKDWRGIWGSKGDGGAYSG